MEKQGSRLISRCAGLLIASVIAVMPVAAQNSIQLKPTGEHAIIDTTLAHQTMQAPTSSSARERQHAVALMSAPQRDAPPVFYALSHVMLVENKPKRAMCWFYAGQLRGRFDANRRADESARQAIGVLNNNYGMPINPYTFQHLPTLENTVAEIVACGRHTPYDYDHRWIKLHGMGATIAAMGGQADQGAE